jgi:hypothetical protein
VMMMMSTDLGLAILAIGHEDEDRALPSPAPSLPPHRPLVHLAKGNQARAQGTPVLAPHAVVAEDVAAGGEAEGGGGPGGGRRLAEAAHGRHHRGEGLPVVRGGWSGGKRGRRFGVHRSFERILIHHRGRGLQLGIGKGPPIWSWSGASTSILSIKMGRTCSRVVPCRPRRVRRSCWCRPPP